MGGVIFDLDQTLVDSSTAELLRKNGQWKKVYSLISQFQVYPGILDSVRYLRDKKIPYSIVTTSPSNYCTKVITHWDLLTPHMVCYHDTVCRKPDPEGMLKALVLMGCKPSDCLSFGDRDIDIQASNAAGIPSVACIWGATDTGSLMAANPQYVLDRSHDMNTFLQRFF